MNTDPIERIKQEVSIIKVIERCGFRVIGHGKHLHTAEHDSLIIDTERNCFHWNSRGVHGDNIRFIEHHDRVDFKTAVERVAEIGGVPAPDWNREAPEVRIAARTRADAFSVATDVFSKWLAASSDGMGYARGRGWTDDTIEAAKLGYTGIVEKDLTKEERSQKYDEMRKELHNEFQFWGVDIDSPGAVAITGKYFKTTAELNQWAASYNIENLPETWKEQHWIPGVIGQDAIVYPHIFGKNTVYISLRGIHEKKHYNLPMALAGEKRLYMNPAWAPNKHHVILVEGQADAISLGQLGYPSIALAGVNADDGLGKLVEGHTTVYVALDNDEAGKENLDAVCKHLSPLVQVLRWPDHYKETPVKDANDLLLAMIEAGKSPTEQGQIVQAYRQNVISYLETRAAAVGNETDPGLRETGKTEVAKLFVTLEEDMQINYKDRVYKALQVSKSTFNALVKAFKGKLDAEDDDGPDEWIPTWGGFYDGWLFEYLYDPTDQTAMLAYRDPEGNIGSKKFVDILVNGIKKRYYPHEPYEFVTKGSIVFPARIGEKIEQSDLIGMLSKHISKYFLFDDELWPRIIAYWILMSWMYDAFNAICYLRVIGESGSGKSMLTERVGWLAYRPIRSMGADTPAVMFRTIAMFGGTLIIDEYDQMESDTTSNWIKILNSGAMKGGVTNRLQPVKDANGNDDYWPMPYTTFCPKILNGRKDPKDDALINRCITIHLLPKTTLELLDNDIPFETTSEFREKSMHFQELLLRWRLENWQPEIELEKEDHEKRISSRMNQVTGPMKALARISNDTALRDDLDRLMVQIYQEEVMSRAESLPARVIEALWKMYLYNMTNQYFSESGEDLTFFPGDVADVTNTLIDEMNSNVDDGDDEDDDESHSHRVEVKSRKIGSILRNELQLKQYSAGRRSRGIPYLWNMTKMMSHAMRYGLDWEREVEIALRMPEVPQRVMALAARHQLKPREGNGMEGLVSVLMSESELKKLLKPTQERMFG